MRTYCISFSPWSIIFSRLPAQITLALLSLFLGVKALNWRAFSIFFPCRVILFLSCGGFVSVLELLLAPLKAGSAGDSSLDLVFIFPLNVIGGLIIRCLLVMLMLWGFMYFYLLLSLSHWFWRRSWEYEFYMDCLAVMSFNLHRNLVQWDY